MEIIRQMVLHSGQIDVYGLINDEKILELPCWGLLDTKKQIVTDLPFRYSLLYFRISPG